MSEAKKEDLKIVTIVNTHAHGDHTAGNAKLKSLTGAEIIIHALDAKEYPGADILIIDQDTFQLGEITYEIIHKLWSYTLINPPLGKTEQCQCQRVWVLCKRLTKIVIHYGI